MARDRVKIQEGKEEVVIDVTDSGAGGERHEDVCYIFQIDRPRYNPIWIRDVGSDPPILMGTGGNIQSVRLPDDEKASLAEAQRNLVITSH